jgi:hypothetical protein
MMTKAPTATARTKAPRAMMTKAPTAAATAAPTRSPRAMRTKAPTAGLSPINSPAKVLRTRAPTAASTLPLWVNPEDSEFSPLSTDDGTDVETITLRNDDIAIVNIGFAYNWFGNDLTQLVIQSNGQLHMDRTNYSTSPSVVQISDFSGSRIAFANGDLGGGAVKVGRKSGADESFKVSFENIQWFTRSAEINVINVQVELFPNGDIIFCYGSGEMDGPTNSRMVAGVENSDLGKAFEIPDYPFDSFGITFEWPTDSCWKFQMP